MANDPSWMPRIAESSRHHLVSPSLPLGSWFALCLLLHWFHVSSFCSLHPWAHWSEDGHRALAVGCTWPYWSNPPSWVADPTSVNLLAPWLGLFAFSRTGNQGWANLQGFRWAFCSDKLPRMFLLVNSNRASFFLGFNLCLSDIPTDLEPML